MCMQFRLSKTDVAVIGTVALVTLPIWFVPAAGAVLVSTTKDSIQDLRDRISEREEWAKKNGEWWRRRMAALEPLIQACENSERGPTLENLTRVGAALAEFDDFTAARTYLCRAVDVARAEQQTRSPIFAVALYTLGTVHMRFGDFERALATFEECSTVIAGQLAPAAASSSAAAAAAASSSSAAEQPGDAADNKQAPSSVLDRTLLLHKVGLARLHHALYVLGEDTDGAEEAEEGGGWRAWVKPSKERVAAIDRALSELEAALAQHVAANPEAKKQDISFFLARAVARYFALMSRNYRFSIASKQPGFDERLAEVAALFQQVADHKALDPSNGKSRATALSYLSSCAFLAGEFNKGDHFAAEAKVLDDGVHLSVESSEHLPAPSPAGLEDAKVFLFDFLSQPWPLDAILPSVDSGTELHEFKQRKFHRPSWCRACSRFISWEENKSAYCCEHCNFRCHSGACYNKVKGTMCPKRDSAENCESHVHQMISKTLHKPTFCSLCSKFIFGVNASICRTCGVTVHTGCVSLMRNAVKVDENAK